MRCFCASSLFRCYILFQVQALFPKVSLWLRFSPAKAHVVIRFKLATFKIIVTKAMIHVSSSIWQVLISRLEVKPCGDYLVLASCELVQFVLDFLKHSIIRWRDLSIVFANWLSESHIPCI